MANNELLTAALDYAARGWRVLPVNSIQNGRCTCGKKCETPGKHPILTGWPELATTDEATIHKWWQQWPVANIGIATGSGSGIVVLDVDAKDSGPDTLRELMAKNSVLPDTVISLTGGGGAHYLFKHPGQAIKNKVKVDQGIDVRGDGGFIVAPPSNHEGGRSYEWDLLYGPDDLEPAELPGWVLQLMSSGGEKKPRVNVSEPIPDGERNETLFKYACKLRGRDGLDEDTIFAILKGINAQKCDPPLPDNELLKIAYSAGKYDAPAKQVEQSDSLGFVDCFDDEGKFVSPILADAIRAKWRFASQAGQLYLYRNGVYVPIHAEFIKAVCQQSLQEYYRDNRGAEVAKQVLTATWREEDFFAADTEEINLANGILNWKTGVLRKHTADYPSRIQLPVLYDPAAQCPTVERFLRDVLDGDCLDMVAELFGYFLIPDTFAQKAFLLKSGGDSGKSVFLDLLAAFLGRENVSGETLQALSDNRFRAANLEGKLANICADIPSKFIDDTSAFKMLVTGDIVSAERKCQQPFMFRNYARLIFSCNEIPHAGDNSNGFFRRWIIINFPNTFPPGSPQRDEKLLSKLTTPEALSGLLNLALDGLRRLKDRGYFDVPASAQKNLENYQRTNDSVRLFCDEEIELSPSFRIDRTTLFERYKSFCADENLKPVSRQKFYSKLREFMPHVGESVVRGTRILTGVRCVGNW